jgi:transglutaminase/protease-like cytokinesis protein 3
MVHNALIARAEYEHNKIEERTVTRYTILLWVIIIGVGGLLILPFVINYKNSSKATVTTTSQRTSQRTLQRDSNGLYPQDYDKNGWAELSNGKWVPNPNGKAIYTSKNSATSATQNQRTTSSSLYMIATDGYIHVENSRYRPNANYTESAGLVFLKGNSTLDNLAQTLKRSSNYDTLLNIYKWITANIAYDTSYSMSDGDIDPSATYNRRKGVCEDYSGLFAYLAEKNGIDVEYVVSGTHAWIEVMVNNRRLYIDPTWGAGYVSNSTFRRQYKPAWFSYSRLADVEVSERSTTKGVHNKIASAQVYIVE